VSLMLSPVSLRGKGRDVGPPLLGAAALYAGEVGDGTAWLGERASLSRIEAVRCEDAAMAAADGSRLALSVGARLSWIIVGDGFFGPLLRKRRLVENLRDRPALLSDAGALGSSGRGCDRSFATFTNGKMSSLSFRFSSDILSISSFSNRSSASRSLRIWMMRAMSSCVGPDSDVSASAAWIC